MEKMTDDELQEMLEKGLQLPAGDDMDAQVYQTLFTELKKGPEQGLPYNFSAKVAARVRLQQDLKLSFKAYLLTFFVVAGALCLIFFIVSMLPHQDSAGYVSFILKYKWVLLFTILCFIAIKYFDQRLQSFKVRY